MGFEQTLHLDYLVKVLRPLAYAKILADRGPRRLAKAMAFAGLARAGCRWWRAAAPGLALAPYRPGAIVAEPAHGMRGQRHARRAARVVSRLSERADGRVHHHRPWHAHRRGPLPHARPSGRDPDGTDRAPLPPGRRRGPLARCGGALRDVARRPGVRRRVGVCLAPHFLAALGDRGFSARDRTPFWLRDRDHGLPRTGWHLTGLEGDIGDRRL